MKLTNHQIEFFKDQGYLFIDKLFSGAEIEQMNEAIKNFSKLGDLPNIIREKDGAIRSIFAPHKMNNIFKKIYRDKRFVVPVQQLLDADVYLYQFKLNNKKALTGEWWEWHQDFPFWHYDDKILNPRLISVMLYLQDTNALQGPLIILPQSHKVGISKFAFKPHLAELEEAGNVNLAHSLSADLKYTIDLETMKSLTVENEPITCEGKAGSCIFFHANLFHASNSNLSTKDRNTAILTYNDIHNLPENQTFFRPDYLCARDTSPIQVAIN